MRTVLKLVVVLCIGLGVAMVGCKSEEKPAAKPTATGKTPATKVVTPATATTPA